MTSNPTPPSSASSTPTSSSAIISLIAGVLGLTLFPLIGSVVAVITGLLARREIRESAGAIEGEGLATAGTVLGLVGLGLLVVGLCAAGAIFGVPICIGIFALGGEFGALLPMTLAAL